MTSEFLLLLVIGFVAQLVDGALGMAYGVLANAAMLALGLPPAQASALVHTRRGLYHRRVGDLAHLSSQCGLAPGVAHRLHRRARRNLGRLDPVERRRLGGATLCLCLPAAHGLCILYKSTRIAAAREQPAAGRLRWDLSRDFWMRAVAVAGDR
jgi:hypothetical protein